MTNLQERLQDFWEKTKEIKTAFRQSNSPENMQSLEARYEEAAKSLENLKNELFRSSSLNSVRGHIRAIRGCLNQLLGHRAYLDDLIESIRDELRKIIASLKKDQPKLFARLSDEFMEQPA